MVVEVKVSYQPEHFNKRALATIPATWIAEVVNVEEILETQFTTGTYYRLYGLGDTRQEAIDSLIEQLQRFGKTGVLRFVN